MWCWNCGLSFEGRVLSRSLSCEGCDSDLRCCKQCRFWISSSESCNEPQAELPRDAQKANFCDWFQAGTSRGQQQKNDLRAQAEALFKKKL